MPVTDNVWQVDDTVRDRHYCSGCGGECVGLGVRCSEWLKRGNREEERLDFLDVFCCCSASRPLHLQLRSTWKSGIRRKQGALRLSTRRLRTGPRSIQVAYNTSRRRGLIGRRRQSSQ
jgi:hypothetical protein